MDFVTESAAIVDTRSDCLVLALYEDGPFTASAAAVDKASNGLLSELKASGDIDGALGKCHFVPRLAGISSPRVLVVGMGAADKLTLARFDRACLAAGKALRNHRLTRCHVALHEADVVAADDSQCLRQAAIGLMRANYLYSTTKKPKDNAAAPLAAASFQAGTEMQPILDQAHAIGQGFNTACELGDLPPNICTPAYLEQEARRMQQELSGVELDVLDEAAMAELDMDALLGVSRGSAHEARLIVLRYNGGAEGEQPIVFVGKGITFDTGGLSLKSGDNMMQMKFDMCGAAGVMGAFQACVAMAAPVNLICIVAAVENMPDGDAYRPGDVLTSMSGQTIEVLNTDAEGRLVLCDAITYSRRFDPRAVIDVATLTGACMIALGHHASGLMTNCDDLADELLDAGTEIVDRAWRLPLWEEYQSQLDTPFADMKNVGGMPAGVLTAGCFLSRFAEGLNWAHIDVAGSAWEWGKTSGASGRPVGLLCQYVLNQAG